MHKHIPDDVDTLDDLHNVIHRGKEEDDWSMVDAQFVNLRHAEISYIYKVVSGY
jgi:hypothetical protein